MAVDDPLSLLFALSTVCITKYIAAILWRKKKLQKFKYVGEISALNIHPVKSCGPLSLNAVTCTATGLGCDGVCDRYWMVVDKDGLRVNIQREPKMALIKPSVRDNKLCLNAPAMPTLELEKNPRVDRSLFINSKVHGMEVIGMSCGEKASEWINKYLGVEELSVVVSTSTMKKRNVSDLNKPWVNSPNENDTVTFAEVSVGNITCESSLVDLNTRLKNPVVMGNFRPSIVVKGSEPFDEDSWKEIRIGNTVFMRLLEPNQRCLQITVDPNGKRDPDIEPIKTLRKFRKSPKYGDSPLFGINTVVDREGVIKVGDPVYVFRD